MTPKISFPILALLLIYSLRSFAVAPIPRERLKLFKAKCTVDYLWRAPSGDVRKTESHELSGTGAVYDDDGQALTAAFQTLPRFKSLKIHFIHVLTGTLNSESTAEPAHLTLLDFDGEGTEPIYYFSKDQADLNPGEKLAGTFQLPGTHTVPDLVNELSFACGTPPMDQSL